MTLKLLQEAFKNLTMEAMLREGHANSSSSHSDGGTWGNNNHSQSLKIMKPSEGQQPVQTQTDVAHEEALIEVVGQAAIG